MKTALILLLASYVAANFEEEAPNRRHNLIDKVHRRLQQDDASMSIQLTRTPTAGRTTKRVVPPQTKPSESPAAAADKTNDADIASDAAGTERAGKRPDAIVKDNANANAAPGDPTKSPSYIMPSYSPTTFVPTFMPTMMSGKSRKVNMDDYDDDSISKSGKTGAGGGKAGKASRVSYCEQAFDKAWKANKNADFAIAKTQDELKKRCEFDDTVTNKSPFSPNLACPFVYSPDDGFIDSEEVVIEFFEEFFENNTEIGEAFWALQMYCECAKGIDEQCVAKVPDIPPIDETGLDYCIFAGIWNGDIELDLLDSLDEEVQECGCTFVWSEKEEVSECPGLDLGANYVIHQA